MPLFDVTALLEEDEVTKGLDLPSRFGKSFDVNLTLKDGKWQKTDTTEVWTTKTERLLPKNLQTKIISTMVRIIIVFLETLIEVTPETTSSERFIHPVFVDSSIRL